jgi:hypothetical protein
MGSIEEEEPRAETSHEGKNNKDNLCGECPGSGNVVEKRFKRN